jgi:hypothetical protein
MTELRDNQTGVLISHRGMNRAARRRDYKQNSTREQRMRLRLMKRARPLGFDYAKCMK